VRPLVHLLLAGPEEAVLKAESLLVRLQLAVARD